MAIVKDPELLKKLNSGSDTAPTVSGGPVTDPEILAQLNGNSPLQKFTTEMSPAHTPGQVVQSPKQYDAPKLNLFTQPGSTMSIANPQDRKTADIAKQDLHNFATIPATFVNSARGATGGVLAEMGFSPETPNIEPQYDPLSDSYVDVDTNYTAYKKDPALLKKGLELMADADLVQKEIDKGAQTPSLAGKIAKGFSTTAGAMAPTMPLAFIPGIGADLATLGMTASSGAQAIKEGIEKGLTDAEILDYRAKLQLPEYAGERSNIGIIANMLGGKYKGFKTLVAGASEYPSETGTTHFQFAAQKAYEKPGLTKEQRDKIYNDIVTGKALLTNPKLRDEYLAAQKETLIAVTGLVGGTAMAGKAFRGAVNAATPGQAPAAAVPPTAATAPVMPVQSTVAPIQPNVAPAPEPTIIPDDQTVDWAQYGVEVDQQGNPLVEGGGLNGQEEGRREEVLTSMPGQPVTDPATLETLNSELPIIDRLDFTSNNQPFRPEQLNFEIGLMKNPNTTKAAVLVPANSGMTAKQVKDLATENGFKALRANGEVYIYDPAQIPESTLRAQIKSGRNGQALGYGTDAVPTDGIPYAVDLNGHGTVDPAEIMALRDAGQLGFAGVAPDMETATAKIREMGRDDANVRGTEALAEQLQQREVVRTLDSQPGEGSTQAATNGPAAAETGIQAVSALPGVDGLTGEGMPVVQQGKTELGGTDGNVQLRQEGSQGQEKVPNVRPANEVTTYYRGKRPGAQDLPGTTFYSPSRDFAGWFADGQTASDPKGEITEHENPAKGKKVFDYENPEHRALLDKIVKGAGKDLLAEGDWALIESKPVQAAIRKAGFDGFYVSEEIATNTGEPVRAKNLAMYEAEKTEQPVKSANRIAEQLVREALPKHLPFADAMKQARAIIAGEATQPRRGTMGDMLESGEVVLTASGRSTTPFPKINFGNNRAAGNTMKAVDKWLMENALAEAESRGDEFNARQFRANKDKPQQADKDSAELYLFGDTQPAVVPSITKPLTSTKGIGFIPMFERQQIAIAKFAETLQSLAGISKDEADAVTQQYLDKKLATLDAVSGTIRVKHGAYLDVEAIRNAARQTKEQVGPKAKPAAKKAPAKLDTQKDDIIVAISKLGGIDYKQAQSQWGKMVKDDRKALDRHVLEKTRRFGSVFKAKGLPLDKIREALVENGYLPESADLNDLFTAVENAIKGKVSESVEKTAQGPVESTAEYAEYVRNLEQQAEAGNLELKETEAGTADAIIDIVEDYDPEVAADAFSFFDDIIAGREVADDETIGQAEDTETTKGVFAEGESADTGRGEVGTETEIPSVDDFARMMDEAAAPQKGRDLFTPSELQEFDRLGIDVSQVTAQYKTEALQQLSFQQEQNKKLKTSDYNANVQAEYDRIARQQAIVKETGNGVIRKVGKKFEVEWANGVTKTYHTMPEAERGLMIEQPEAAETIDASGWKQEIAVKADKKPLTIGGVQKQGGKRATTSDLLDGFTPEPAGLFDAEPAKSPKQSKSEKIERWKGALAAYVNNGDAANARTDTIDRAVDTGLVKPGEEVAFARWLIDEGARQHVLDYAKEEYGQSKAAPVSMQDHISKAIDAGADALNEIFKGLTDPNKLGSGLGFDDATYQKAKPHFQKMWDEIRAAGFSFKEAAQEFAKQLVSKFGATIKPYALKFYGELAEAERSGTIEAGGTDNVERQDTERPSQDPATQDALGQEDIQPRPAGTGRESFQGVQDSQGEGFQPDGDSVIPRSETAPAGERSNQPVRGEEERPGLEAGPSGSNERERGSDTRDEGVPVESVSAAAVAQAVDEPVPAGAAKKGSIDSELPQLHPGQREDVAFAEARFEKPDGFGVMFTNGTGTGKTALGLGIARRFVNRGKKNILIIAPNQDIIAAWINLGKSLNLLDLKRLADTKDNGGSGPVITTYANMGQNSALASRKWDLIITDEADNLSSNKNGDPSLASRMLQAITLHPDGVSQRTELLNPELLAQRNKVADKLTEARKLRLPTEALDKQFTEIERKWQAAREKVKAEVEASQNETRPRVTFLSATPFAYEKSVDYVEGYLFDYGPRVDSGRYNSGNNYERFMMQHFGYRMRYNKLTEPPPEVDRGIMQRQFNSWLKRQGVLSGRVLDVDADYDRKFVLIESGIGNKIDEGLTYLRENRRMQAVERAVQAKFDHLSRRYLLEAIKAEAVIPLVKDNLALGRQVVIFHDFNKGGGFNPFDVSSLQNSQEEFSYYPEGAKDSVKAKVGDVVREFMAARPDLINLDLNRLPAPLIALKKAFPDILVINGTETAKNRRAAIEAFQDDTDPRKVIIVQSDAGKAGISLHDTTGSSQRVTFNLGLPTKPVTSIQQEGRTYRIGQASNAMFRYLNTGTNWERYAFATTIANRTSAAENLALGESARALRDAFIEGFQESDTYPAGFEGEGTGGKERDRLANSALTEWDRAIAFYFGQKKGRQNDLGADYFATPEPLGLKMVEWAGIIPGDSVLEPSAGHGAIARWFPEDAKRRAIEPSLELASRAALVFDGDMVQGRFEDHNIVNKYNAIVMNPPFGSGGRTAVDHLAKAAKHLKDGGRIVAIIPTGPAADKKFDKWLYEEEVTEIEPIGEIAGQAIYAGDTATYHLDPESQRLLKLVDPRVKVTFTKIADPTSTELFAWVKLPTGQQLSIPTNKLSNIQSTGKREKKQTNDMHLTASYILPSVAFERAGTAVSTRIVVLDKNGTMPQVQRDWSDEKTIKGFFDRIQDAAVPDRVRPAPEEEPVAKGLLSGRDSKLPSVPKVDGVTIAQFNHTKTGKPIYVASIGRKLSDVEYKAAASLAKQHGGHYSGYNGAGAIKGFHFDTVEKRDAFAASLENAPTGDAQFSLTKTPEFKQWFGDSKITNSKGNPLVVYHGSGVKGIGAFDPGKVGTIQRSDWGEGIYFTPSKWLADGYRETAVKNLSSEVNKEWENFEATAKSFGTDVMNMWLDLRAGKITQEQYDNIREQENKWRAALKTVEQSDAGEVYPVYLKVNNPLNYTYAGITDYTLSSQAKANGKDGVIVRNEDGDIEEIIVFSPGQIKSVFNSGQFDPSNPDIRYSLGNDDTTLSPDALVKIENLIGQALPGGKVSLNIVPSIQYAGQDSEAAYAAHGVKGGKVAGVHQATVNLTTGEVKSIITLAMDGATDSTGYHEAEHAAESLGIIKPSDILILERTYPDKDGVSSSERRADAFAYHVSGKQIAKGYARNIFDRVQAFLRKLKRVLTGKGWRTAEDVFNDLMGGKLKRNAQGVAVPSAGVQFAAAWHGSPHDFDKFQSHAIGTGEGAQAYGYGLYFAGSKEVAEFYKNALSKTLIYADGKRIGTFDGMSSTWTDKVARALYKDRPTQQNADTVLQQWRIAGFDWEKAKDEVNSLNHYFRDRALEVFEDVKNRVEVKKKGKLYHVELAPAEDEYLLWDKPLSEQSEKVKKALENKLNKVANNVVLMLGGGSHEYALSAIMRDKGAAFYSSLEDDFEMSDNPQRSASEFLHSLGIRGIKYLDGTSRGKGDGNYNYVIFSDEDVTIQAKFSLAKPAGKFQSSSDEIQKRRDAAHGLAKGPGLIERLKDMVDRIKRETQHFPELDMKKDAQTADILRVFESSRNAATAKTVAYLKSLTGHLTPDEMNNFEWRILLDDLMEESAKGHALPFGYTPETLAEDHARIVEMTDNNESIKVAMERRAKTQAAVVKELVDNGMLPESVLDTKNYFRHMVLEYANAKKWAGLGSQELRNKKRGWQKGRQGSELDINTNFLEAEFEVYSQQLKELATKEALDKVEKINNIAPKLKQQAKNQNFENLVGGPENVRRIRRLEGEAAELRAGEIDNGVKQQLAAITQELDELDPTRPYKRSMAIGLGRLSKLASNGELPTGKMKGIAEALANGEPTEKLFNYISFLAGEDGPGTIPARQVLKAVADLDKLYRTVLGPEYLEHRRMVDRRLIPEGYVEWQPEKGNVFHRETTLPEQIVDKAIASTWSVEELVNSGVLKEAVVMAGKKRTLVMPEGVALTLDNLRFERDTAVLDTINKKAIGAWKIWTLLSPRRVLKYNLNNMSGDLDVAVAADPKILKYMGDAWNHALNRKKGNLTAEDEDMLDRGVLDSGISINEIPDISQLPFFRDLTDDQRKKKIWEVIRSGDLSALAPPSVIAKYFDKISSLTNLREGLLREAAYRRALELLKQGKKIAWASNPEELAAIPDMKDKAAKLSRELIGDYGNISAHGEKIRARYLPFWSWMEINAPRYYRIFRNAAQEGGKYSTGARVIGVAGKKFVGTTAGMVEKLVLTQALFALATAFNHLVHGDDDDDLDQKQLHLIMGKDSNGKILSVRFQGAFSDALSWFGLEDYPETVRKIQDGSMSTTDLARKMALATPNKLANAALPFVKLAAETAVGKSIYPDMTKPRMIRDRGEHIARFVSLDSEYRALAGKPSKGYADSLKGVLFYTTDPREQAYNDIRSQAMKWMEKQGKEMPGGDPTNRSNALYYYKQAKRFGDDEAAKAYLKEYFTLGGTPNGLTTSIRNAQPLHATGNQTGAFIQSLSPADKRKLKLAMKFYQDVYR